MRLFIAICFDEGMLDSLSEIQDDLIRSGVKGNYTIRENLRDYVGRLRSALLDEEIPFDRKKFMPHVTLIRKADCTKGKALLGNIEDVEKMISNHDTPVFVYCLRGTRSTQAVTKMKAMGYINAKSIGGIASYKGLTVR